jgi:competence transcription factor ComK
VFVANRSCSFFGVARLGKKGDAVGEIGVSAVI